MSPPTPVPGLRGLTAYHVPKARFPIDLPLHGNEGPPPPPDLLAALIDPEIVRRYPSAAPLEAHLAARLAIPPSQVLVTAGADEALDRAFRAFLQAGDRVVLPSPTFVMLPHYARLIGAEVIAPPWPAEVFPEDLALAALAAEPRPRAIALVSPNNPTGALIPTEAIHRIAAAAPETAILVDFAYVETADHDPTRELLVAHDNVLVFRTLSKVWGLAGLRVGYVAAAPPVIAALRAAGPPYSVTAPSIALALAHLETGEARMRAYVDAVRAEREELYAVLRAGGAQPVRSHANFVFSRLSDAGAALAFRDGLARRGIGVRAFSDPGLDDGVRITCPGDPSQHARLCAAIDEVLGELKERAA